MTTKTKKKTIYLHKCKLLVKLKTEIKRLRQDIMNGEACGCSDCSKSIVRYRKQVKDKTARLNSIKKATEAFLV